jgi:hypothetical protein
MEVALRRSYGYAFAPPLNSWGMGDLVSDLIAAGVSPADAEAYAVSSSPTEGIAPIATSSPIGTTLDYTVAACAADPNCSMPTGPTGSLYSQLIAQGVLPIDAQAYDPAGAAAAGFTAPAGSTSTAGTITAAAQIATALSRAISPTAGMFGGTTSCPAGYVYGVPGASVQIAPGVATVGTGKCLPSTVPTGVIPGVSNTTLGIAAVVFFALMMMGKKR